MQPSRKLALQRLVHQPMPRDPRLAFERRRDAVNEEVGLTRRGAGNLHGRVVGVLGGIVTDGEIGGLESVGELKGKMVGCQQTGRRTNNGGLPLSNLEVDHLLNRQARRQRDGLTSLRGGGNGRLGGHGPRASDSETAGGGGVDESRQGREGERPTGGDGERSAKESCRRPGGTGDVHRGRAGDGQKEKGEWTNLRSWNGRTPVVNINLRVT
jgi:hypothetical protein